jgi:hypothetical protein
MRGIRWILAVLSALLLFTTGVGPAWAWADVGDIGLEKDDVDVVLSSYWHPRVQQWSDLIVEEAAHRELDPDFLASVVWMESRGRSQAVGPVGAVGLMQVMPREAGFTWRPTEEQLMDPSVNLFWGTRTLATVIKQGDGDIFNALAAYNGGWHQTQYRGPKHFATTILRDYAEVVAQRYDILWSEHWLAVFAVTTPGVKGPIWIADSARDDVYFYSNDNWIPEGSLLIPEDVPPTAILASFEDVKGRSCCVGVWLYRMGEDAWVQP